MNLISITHSYQLTSEKCELHHLLNKTSQIFYLNTWQFFDIKSGFKCFFFCQTENEQTCNVCKNIDIKVNLRLTADHPKINLDQQSSIIVCSYSKYLLFSLIMNIPTYTITSNLHVV